MRNCMKLETFIFFSVPMSYPKSNEFLHGENFIDLLFKFSEKNYFKKIAYTKIN